MKEPQQEIRLELDYWIDVCKGLAGHSFNISDNAVKCQEFLHRYWADVPPVILWQIFT